jgi:hypothetical protein
MRRATTVVISAAVLPGLLALGACSGSSTTPSAAASNITVASGGATSSAPTAKTAAASPYGNVGLSSTALNAALVAAAGSATAVHISGSVSSQSGSISIDVQLNKDGTSAGTITSSSGSIPFISTGGVLYLQATAGFISLTGLAAGSPEVAALQNKWVPSTNKDSATVANGYSVFMSMSAFVAQSIDSGDSYAADGTGTVNGQAVAKYQDITEGNGALVLSVPVSGSVLPVQDAESASGSMSFVWNQPSKINPPPAGQIYTGS